ncbi:MAG: hypothetical protein IPJ94_22025 [Chloroflexi bacterium]|nr:hypothetical protein [Chloroflexota bacterium]
MKEARQLAAKQAAATPRGGNMRIGNLREQAGKQPTAFDGVKNDPLTAVKIAAIHGWDGLRTGMVVGAPAPVAASRNCRCAHRLRRTRSRQRLSCY